MLVDLYCGQSRRFRAAAAVPARYRRHLRRRAWSSAKLSTASMRTMTRNVRCRSMFTTPPLAVDRRDHSASRHDVDPTRKCAAIRAGSSAASAVHWSPTMVTIRGDRHLSTPRRHALLREQRSRVRFRTARQPASRRRCRSYKSELIIRIRRSAANRCSSCDGDAQTNYAAESWTGRNVASALASEATELCSIVYATVVAIDTSNGSPDHIDDKLYCASRTDVTSDPLHKANCVGPHFLSKRRSPIRCGVFMRTVRLLADARSA